MQRVWKVSVEGVDPTDSGEFETDFCIAAGTLEEAGSKARQIARQAFEVDLTAVGKRRSRLVQQFLAALDVRSCTFAGDLMEPKAEDVPGGLRVVT